MDFDDIFGGIKFSDADAGIDFLGLGLTTNEEDSNFAFPTCNFSGDAADGGETTPGATDKPDEEGGKITLPVSDIVISSEDAEFLQSVETPTPLVQNIIASVNMLTELDLRRIAVSARNAEYNPRKVNAVVIRLRAPKCTGLVFRTGKMMVTGAKSDADAKCGGKKMAKLCQKAGHPDVRFYGFKIENYIATVDCNFPVRLEGLANHHKEFCSYEPEIFPGLVYRFTVCKAVLLIFSSGKIVITGCKTTTEVNEVFEAMFPVLVQYRK